MTTTFIVRRGAQRVRQARAQVESAREVKVLGVAESLYRAQAAVPSLDPDTLLIDLCLEDGAALSLVRRLRQCRGGWPKVMLVVPDGEDPLLFSTLVSGADAYLFEADLPMASSVLGRLMAGEAMMCASVAAQVLWFFNESLQTTTSNAAPADDRDLDWRTHCANPRRLSPGEVRLGQLLAQGSRSGEVAACMAQSVEMIGRRIATIYRKLSWGGRSGALSLRAA